MAGEMAAALAALGVQRPRARGGVVPAQRGAKLEAAAGRGFGKAGPAYGGWDEDQRWETWETGFRAALDSGGCFIVFRRYTLARGP